MSTFIYYSNLMKIIKNLIANIVVCWILLYVFNYFSLGIKFDFSNPATENSIISLIWIFLILGFIFRVFNSPIKWILKTLSCPVNFLTLWLASIAINVLIFYLFAYVINNYLDLGVAVKLWEIRQTLILSFIMSIGITVLTKIL